MPDALTIKIAVSGGKKKDIKAWRVSERVAVHRTSYAPGAPKGLPETWTISDPVTGRRYPVVAQGTRATALRIARLMVSRFGENPLAGGKLDTKSGRFSTKPTQYEALRKFILDVNYGHINP